MTLIRWTLLLTVTLTLQGCARYLFLEQEAGIGKRTPQQLVAEAERFKSQGNWQRGIELLKSGLEKYPKSPLLQKKSWEMEKGWQDIRLTIDHKILLIETNALRQRLELLKILNRGEDRSAVTRARLSFWKSVLKKKSQDLLACFDYQLGKDRDLATLCLNLAERIKKTKAVEKRIAELKARKKKIQNSERFRELSQINLEEGIDKKKPGKAMKIKVKPKIDRRREKVMSLMHDADEAEKKEDYASAVMALKAALQIQPESGEFWNDIERFQAKIDQQIERLIHLGEVYYGYDQLEEAVAAWERVLQLDPDRRDIVERINRAQKVLLKLETIKRSADEAG